MSENRNAPGRYLPRRFVARVIVIQLFALSRIVRSYATRILYIRPSPLSLPLSVRAISLTVLNSALAWNFWTNEKIGMELGPRV